MKIHTTIHLLLSFGTCNCGPDHYRELGTNRSREETSSILQQHQAKQLVRTSHIFSYVWLCTLEQNKVQISLIIVRSILFSHHHLLLDNFEKKGSSLRIIEQKMLYLSQIPIWWVVSLSFSLCWYDNYDCYIGVIPQTLLCFSIRIPFRRHDDDECQSNHSFMDFFLSKWHHPLLNESTSRRLH